MIKIGDTVRGIRHRRSGAVHEVTGKVIEIQVSRKVGVKLPIVLYVIDTGTSKWALFSFRLTKLIAT